MPSKPFFFILFFFQFILTVNIQAMNVDLEENKRQVESLKIYTDAEYPSGWSKVMLKQRSKFLKKTQTKILDQLGNSEKPTDFPIEESHHQLQIFQMQRNLIKAELERRKKLSEHNANLRAVGLPRIQRISYESTALTSLSTNSTSTLSASSSSSLSPEILANIDALKALSSSTSSTSSSSSTALSSPSPSSTLSSTSTALSSSPSSSGLVSFLTSLKKWVFSSRVSNMSVSYYGNIAYVNNVPYTFTQNICSILLNSVGDITLDTTDGYRWKLDDTTKYFVPISYQTTAYSMPIPSMSDTLGSSGPGPSVVINETTICTII